MIYFELERKMKISSRRTKIAVIAVLTTGENQHDLKLQIVKEAELVISSLFLLVRVAFPKL